MLQQQPSCSSRPACCWRWSRPAALILSYTYFYQAIVVVNPIMMTIRMLKVQSEVPSFSHLRSQCQPRQAPGLRSSCARLDSRSLLRLLLLLLLMLMPLRRLLQLPDLEASENHIFMSQRLLKSPITGNLLKATPAEAAGAQQEAKAAANKWSGAPALSSHLHSLHTGRRSPSSEFVQLLFFESLPAAHSAGGS